MGLPVAGKTTLARVALVEQGLRHVGKAFIAVRAAAADAETNPFSFEYVQARIEHALTEYIGRHVVLRLPDIEHVFYGRDVGYRLKRLHLDDGLEAISVTSIRDWLRSGNAE